MKAILKLTILSTIAALAGCGGAAMNSNTTSSNSAMKMENSNMPSAMAPAADSNTNAAAPGIPTVIANMPKGATPTPGIPSAEEMKKGVKKGATPTPGIPSAEEMRKQMGGAPPSTANETVPSDTMMKKDGGSMMKKDGGSMMKKNTNNQP